MQRISSSCRTTSLSETRATAYCEIPRSKRRTHSPVPGWQRSSHLSNSYSSHAVVALRFVHGFEGFPHCIIPVLKRRAVWTGSAFHRHNRAASSLDITINVDLEAINASAPLLGRVSKYLTTAPLQDSPKEDLLATMSSLDIWCSEKLIP